ncbi:MAG: hypothetical protein LBW85_01265 [Deltaproteobacteria bacterium]|nr:hypothetical protein [Deltaproteobacteria bacterium]
MRLLLAALALAALLPDSAPDAGLGDCRAEAEYWRAMWQEQEARYADVLIRLETDFQALRDAVADAPEACGLLAGNVTGELLEDLGCRVP